jgi:hypothetical protein
MDPRGSQEPPPTARQFNAFAGEVKEIKAILAIKIRDEKNFAHFAQTLSKSVES